MSLADITDRLRGAGCVFAEDEAALLSGHAAETGADLDDLVEQRCAGEPLEYLVGWAMFRGLRIAVRPGVFVPRRRTEYLAELAIIYARHAGRRPTLLDLCCGAGAVGAAVRAQLPRAKLYATDIDADAVACARINLGERVEVFQGDLFAALPTGLHGRLDVIVANAPYVPTDGIALLPPEAREHERRIALDGGPDGMDVARRIFAAAPAWLAPGGTVLVELGAAQAIGLTEEAAAGGLSVDLVHHDGYGETALAATLPR